MARAAKPPAVHVDESDLIVLRMDRERGRVEIPVWVEGVAGPDAAALQAHCNEMVREGYLRFTGISGSKARMQGAAQTAIYEATEAGRAVLALWEALDG